MRFIGVNNNGEELSSMYVDHDPDTFGFATTGPSLTRQEFLADCDINTIMAQYEKTGVISHVNNGQPQYLDVTDVPDLAQAIEVVKSAEAAFMRLPASVRREFDNDPVQFVDYVQNAQESDRERLREWGLIPPLPPEKPPQKVEVVSQTPPTATSGSDAKK
ncbi:internal scaffolding protein [Blackfly microvirus SF02]|uniref:Internal scaffolding protein n=1 Tax=Blackfly microvirus SF02 TaxID=2576452 RepID=A0A4P8PSR7_9VIRU|nr:internal scaffolding protein [Blackfly microvirus SF02]